MKPFDIELAKQGKPVCTRDGREARIICFDKRGCYPVIALVQEEGMETCHFYSQEGKCADCGNKYDLMMASEKKEMWINIYKETIRPVPGAGLYDTKEEAKDSIRNVNSYIATVKVCWEE